MPRLVIPSTTAQIHQAQGGYLVQVKANQPTLLAAVHALAATAVPLGTRQSVDKAHGRLEVRHATFFSLARSRSRPAGSTAACATSSAWNAPPSSSRPLSARRPWPIM